MPQTQTTDADRSLSTLPRRIVCVDLDGTLIVGDLFWEGLIALLKRSPLIVLVLPIWLARGRAYFKRQVAERTGLKPETLTYRDELLEYLHSERLAGTELVLATASDERYADRVAAHLGLFSSVIASDGSANLSGRAKAARLVRRYGEGGFEYVGNDWADLATWRLAAKATVVSAPRRLVARVRRHGINHQVLNPRGGGLSAVWRALRVHHWSKNVLVFLPLLGAHEVLRIDLFGLSLLTCAALSLCASAVYVLNDLCDLQADRAHPDKRTRPFASGDLSVPTGIGLAVVLLSGAFGLAFVAHSWIVAAVLLVYVLANAAYSLRLKREPVADVFVLAGFYVLRIVAGSAATGIPLSNWLLGFALFFFLSLAFVKRYVELTSSGHMPGRAYTLDDERWMHAIGTSSGYMAVLVLALYVNAPEVTALYSRPKTLLILGPLLLYWLTRMWLRAGRSLVKHDPVLDALKDRVSYAIAAAAAAVLVLAK